MPERHQRFNNVEAITIDSVAARSIVISADSDLREELAGAVYMDAEFEDQAEMDAVVITEGRELVLKGKPAPSMSGRGNIFNSFGRSAKVSVGDIVGRNSVSIINGRVIVDGVEVAGDATSGQKQATLEIVFAVPIGFPVRIVGGGGTEFTVDTRGGRLLADIEGSCTLRASDVISPEVEANGSCNVAIGRMRQGGKFEGNGGSKITVDQADGGDLKAEMNGGSEFTVHLGEIGSLHAEANGAAKISAFVTAAKADLEAAGAATIVVSEVKGKVKQDRAGAAQITVLKTSGSGEAKSGGAWWKFGSKPDDSDYERMPSAGAADLPGEANVPLRNRKRPV